MLSFRHIAVNLSLHLTMRCDVYLTLSLEMVDKASEQVCLQIRPVWFTDKSVK
jgi:hypothetical protein